MQMDYLLTAQEMKKADTAMSEQFGMHSLVLMERAALSAFQIILEKYPDAKHFLIFCGCGNNGGDGIALARLLFLAGKEVTIAIPEDTDKHSVSFGVQLHTAKEYKLSVVSFPAILEHYDHSSYDCIIDALFGIGLNRELTEPFLSVISAINRRAFSVPCISLDIPSGIHTDTGRIMGSCVRADLTIPFSFHKLGLVRYPGCEYTGQVILGDAGITEHALSATPRYFTFTKEDVISRLPRRTGDSNKGSYGKVLIFAGSKNMAGASILCANACFYTGVGMVKLITCEQNRIILQTSVPEAMLFTYDTDKKIRIDEELVSWADSILIGPGISMQQDAKDIMQQLLIIMRHHPEKHLIIDADGLNLIAGEESIRSLFEECTCQKYLTPHPGELSRLTKLPIERLRENPEGCTYELRQSLSNTILIGKDSRTMVYDQDSPAIYINTTGNNGMATAGCGDVLSGILAGLCAQRAILPVNNSPFDIACLAVAYHGLLGDFAAAKYGKAAMKAGDLIRDKFLWEDD